MVLKFHLNYAIKRFPNTSTRRDLNLYFTFLCPLIFLWFFHSLVGKLSSYNNTKISRNTVNKGSFFLSCDVTKLESLPENWGIRNWSTYSLASFIYIHKTLKIQWTSTFYFNIIGKVQYFLIIAIYQLVLMTFHISFRWSERKFTA